MKKIDFNIIAEECKKVFNEKKKSSDCSYETIDLIKPQGINSMGIDYFPDYDDVIKIINSQDSFVKGTISRNLLHSPYLGFYHFSSRIWGIDKNKNLLFQLRGFNKDHNAGLLDAPISGHIRNLENVEKNTLREFEEETGLDSKVQNLRLWFISRKMEDYFDNYSKSQFSDKEWVFEHLWQVDDFYELLEYFQPKEGEDKDIFEEVAGLFIIPLKQFKEEIISKNDGLIPEVLGLTKEGKTVYRNITKDSFAYKDPYFYKNLLNNIENHMK